MRLTENLIKKHRRPKSGQLFAWDDLTSGFGVRFTPSATAFVVQWRQSNGAKKRVTLKRWPACSVDQARDLARAQLSNEIEIRDSGGDVQLRTAMRGWFRRQAEAKRWRPRYQAKVDRIISIYIEGDDDAESKGRNGIRGVTLKPNAEAAVRRLGRLAVSQVKRRDVLAVFDNIKRGAGDQFLAIVSSFYGYARDREWTEGNPASNRLKVLGGRAIRHRTPTEAEILALWKAFREEGDPAFGAFGLLLFTGCRRKEITHLARSELDLEASTLTLPADRRKTGKTDPTPFVVDLHPAALDIIRRQPELEENDHVFWGRRDRQAFDFQHFLIKRVRKAAGVKDWRIHDLRRFVRSGMGRLGITQMVSELCLGHVAKGGLVQVYDSHSYKSEKREAWNRWGNHLVKLLQLSAT